MATCGRHTHTRCSLPGEAAPHAGEGHAPSARGISAVHPNRNGITTLRDVDATSAAAWGSFLEGEKPEPGLSNKRLRVGGTDRAHVAEREAGVTCDERGGESGGMDEVAHAEALNGPEGKVCLHVSCHVCLNITHP